MELGTVSVTKGQTNGTVFRLCVIYILRISTFRGGILAQSFMELLMIGICHFFQLIRHLNGPEAEDPRLCHERCSSKGDTYFDHFIGNISVFFLREFQFPNTNCFLTLGKITQRARFKGMLVGNLATSVHQDFTFSLDCSCLNEAAVSAGVFATMIAFNSPFDRCSPALSASFTRFSKRCRLL